jgi:Ca2+-binding EF-hand superfamily protein
MLMSAASGAARSPRAALKVARKLGAEALHRLSFRMTKATPSTSPARVAPRKKGSKGAAPSQQQQQQQRAAAAFTKFDVNGDGSITFKEAVACFRQLARDEGVESVLSSEFLEGAFEQFDTDGDGKIVADEFGTAHACFVEWLKEERAAEEAAAAAAGAPGAQSVEVAELMKDRDTQIESGRPQPRRDPNNEEKARLRKLLDDAAYRVVYTDEERRRLGAKFLRASCGFSQGRPVGAAEAGASFDADSIEQLLEKAESRNLGKAKISIERFRKLSAEAFGIRTAFLQESLFRVCRPGKDAKLSFLEFLRGIAPAAKGTQDERAAFMFTLYDADEQGGVCLTELRTMFAKLEIDCVVEKDLVRFSQHAVHSEHVTSDDEYRYTAYLAHVQEHGESDLIARIRRSLNA